MTVSSQPKRVELVFDSDCPNVEAARELLRAALGEAGLPETWLEWDREAPGTPRELRRYGSPTILVNGIDVAGAQCEDSEVSEASCCRVYQDSDGRLSGVPARRVLLGALLHPPIAR